MADEVSTHLMTIKINSVVFWQCGETVEMRGGRLVLGIRLLKDYLGVSHRSGQLTQLEGSNHRGELTAPLPPSSLLGQMECQSNTLLTPNPFKVSGS
jgi:hypothetical protein